MKALSKAFANPLKSPNKDKQPKKPYKYSTKPKELSEEK